MSAATSPPPATTGAEGSAPAPDGGSVSPAGGVSPHAPPLEACPLCAAPLRPDQEWCLHCGAAARTRLATSSNWKAPIIAVAIVVTLSLGVLAASLVSLNSGSGVTPAAVTIVRTLPAVAVPTTTAPAATAPTTTTPAPSAPATKAPPATTTPRALNKAPSSAPQDLALTKRLIELGVRRANSKSPAEKRRLFEEIQKLRSGK